MVGSKADAFFGNLDVDARGKVDTSEKLVQRSRRRRHGAKDGGLFSHGGITFINQIESKTIARGLPAHYNTLYVGVGLDVNADRAEHVHNSEAATVSGIRRLTKDVRKSE